MGKTRSSKPKDDYFLCLPDSMEKALFQAQRSEGALSPKRISVGNEAESDLEGYLPVSASAGGSKTVRGFSTRGRYFRSRTTSRRSRVDQVNKQEDSQTIQGKALSVAEEVLPTDDKMEVEESSIEAQMAGPHSRKTRNRAIVGDSSLKIVIREGRKRKLVNYVEPESEEDYISSEDENFPRMELSSLKRILEEINVSEKSKEEIGKGQVDIKLDFSGANQPIYKVNPSVITKLLTDCIIHSNKVFPKQTAQLPDPVEECTAIVKALVIYSSRTSPTDSLDLFKSVSTSSRSRRCALKGERKKSRRDVKNWDYVSGLLEYPFPVGFSDKMAAIMSTVADGGIQIPTEVWNRDAPYEESKWPLFEVGCVLSYWLSKLYEDRDFDGDLLPCKLVKGMSHFLELYGAHYDYYIQFSPEDELEENEDEDATENTEVTGEDVA